MCYGFVGLVVRLALLVGASEGDLSPALEMPDEIAEFVLSTAVTDNQDLSIVGGGEPSLLQTLLGRHFGMLTDYPPELALWHGTHQGFDDVEVTWTEEDDHQTAGGQERSFFPPHPHPHLDVLESHLPRPEGVRKVGENEDTHVSLLLLIPPRIHEIGGVLSDVARRENNGVSPIQLLHLRSNVRVSGSKSLTNITQNPPPRRGILFFLSVDCQIL